ncbi:hypothetical protein NDU88_010818 [Pleurodeles waltl]|uniref:Uncharacterized protein n=1 Tax=Pleurodeles waltl TaxID=8319 RepID=A0AAV7QZA0_PLEWA|nr:hypothetical protein NDU88_010818 [Pleurodeles waltl]
MRPPAPVSARPEPRALVATGSVGLPRWRPGLRRLDEPGDRGPPADGATTGVRAVRSAQVPGADCDLGPPADGGATRPASLVGPRRLGLCGAGFGEQRGPAEGEPSDGGSPV